MLKTDEFYEVAKFLNVIYAFSVSNEPWLGIIQTAKSNHTLRGLITASNLGNYKTT